MKILQQEAEKYAKTKSSLEVFQKAHITDYTAGATSDYVKVEKIKFAINELYKLQSKLSGYTFYTGVIKQDVQLQIYELEQQLKTLENGK
jgi:hypothetical protein